MSTATMTRTTVSPAPAPDPPRVTQRRVIRSEWIKLRSVRSTLFSLLAAIVCTVGLGILIALFRNKETVLADEIDLLKW